MEIIQPYMVKGPNFEGNCLLQESIFDTVDSLLSRHRELEVSICWMVVL